MMKAIRLIFIGQIVAGCVAIFFAFVASNAAVHRYARVSAYERLLREGGATPGESKILDLTPMEFASFSSAVARDGLRMSEALLIGGAAVIVLGVAGLILVRRASINPVQRTAGKPAVADL